LVLLITLQFFLQITCGTNDGLKFTLQEKNKIIDEIRRRSRCKKQKRKPLTVHRSHSNP